MTRGEIQALAIADKYKGDCIRCGVQTKSLDKESDLCFGCGQDDLEFEEKINSPPYELGDREAEFKHEKSMQRWSDDMDEQIWDEHFRF